MYTYYVERVSISFSVSYSRTFFSDLILPDNVIKRRRSEKTELEEGGDEKGERGCKKGKKYMGEEEEDENQVLSSSSVLHPAKTVFGGVYAAKEGEKRGLGWLPAIPTPLRSLTIWIQREGSVLSGGGSLRRRSIPSRSPPSWRWWWQSVA